MILTIDAVMAFRIPGDGGIGVSVGTSSWWCQRRLAVALHGVVPRLSPHCAAATSTSSPSTRSGTGCGERHPAQPPATCRSPGAAWPWVALADLYVRLVSSGTITDDPKDLLTTCRGRPMADTRPTTTTSSSSVPAGRPAGRDRGARGGARTAVVVQVAARARPTPSWPRAAWPPRWATCGPRTTGRCTSATRCAAARCSTTGGWPSSTPRRRRTASASSSGGARCSTAPRTAGSLQRDFGGHRYARLAHVGDRTGLEMIRTLQQRAVAPRHRRLHGVHDPAAAKDGDAHRRRVRLLARDRRLRAASRAKAVILATGGIGKSWQGHLELLGVHRRRPRHGAWRGRRR